MENIKIAETCGLCAGCIRAINKAVEELEHGNKVTIFKEIVHNKNVNAYLSSLGAKCESEIQNLPKEDVVIIRAHGEPPETYEYFEKKGIHFKDCTCPNVELIHKYVQKQSSEGHKIIIIGKYKKAMHPEVLGIYGWANNDAILIENDEDVLKLNSFQNERFSLVCQTTFNIAKAEKLIEKIGLLLAENSCELTINKSLCGAQRAINMSSKRLAEKSDVMIVVGGANSSNSIELYNNVSLIVPSIFIEDINDYKKALAEKGISISKDTKIGITAGASTRKEELVELKSKIELDLMRI